MIGALAPKASPSAQPSHALSHDAPTSFLDWALRHNGVGAIAVAPSQRARAKPSQQPAVSVSSVASEMTKPAVSELPVMLWSLSLHIEHRAGAVEVLVLPWRLMATGGLAQVVDMQAKNESGSTAASAELQTHGVVPAADMTAAGPRQAGRPAGCDMEAEMTCAQPAPDPALAMERLEEVSFSAAHTRSDTPTALPWVACLLRWLDDHGEVTLWMRDFRLDEGEKRALVARLRTAVMQLGFRLDRIVINSRTYWHVHRPTREYSHAR